MHFMAEHAHFFSLLEVEGRNFTDVLRQGTQQHISDMVRIVKAGPGRRHDPRGGPDPHGARRGRARSGTSPTSTAPAGSRCRSTSWPRFVARYVVHSVAADEQAIARRAPGRHRRRSRLTRDFLHAQCNPG